MENSIALEVEIPEETYLLLANFIENNSPLDFNEVVNLAVSHFLIKHQLPIDPVIAPLSNQSNITKFKRV